MRKRTQYPVPSTQERATARPGTILIVTLWIILALTAMVLALAGAMRVEAVCTANEVSARQAQSIEQGAIQYVLAHTGSLSGAVPTDVDMPCEALPVGRGAFWIIRPAIDPQTGLALADLGLAYGLVDESSKVNLNTAGLPMLSKLPDMTDELAACIFDWRSAGTAPSPGGAKDEYYLMLPDPYQCKKAPLETLEELFLIKGATREILLGQDLNRNGMIDTEELGAGQGGPTGAGVPTRVTVGSATAGQPDLGLLPYVTVYSVEPNTSADGQRRVNVNSPSTTALLALLQKNLDRGMATVVVEMVRFRLRQGGRFENVLDFYTRSGLKPAEFAKVADSLTTSSEATLKGLINVRTAPKAVLACLPGLTDADIAALLAKRADSSIDLTNITWVAQALTPDKARAIGGLITVRSYQFSADVVSVAGDGRAFRRCRVVVDAQATPKLVYRQDLTHLGWPLAPEILAGLRAGVPVDKLVAGRSLQNEVGH